MKPGFHGLRAPWNPGFILFRSLAPGAPPSSEPPAPARARSSRSALTHPSGTGGLLRNRLPNVLQTDRAAIATAMRMCGKPDPRTVRVARIKNTLLASYVDFSANVLPDAERAHVEVTGPPRPMTFDAQGRLRD